MLSGFLQESHCSQVNSSVYHERTRDVKSLHYDDVIMSAIAPRITSLTMVYLNVYSRADQRKHQSSASLDSPHKGPVTRKMVPFYQWLVLSPLPTQQMFHNIALRNPFSLSNSVQDRGISIANAVDHTVLCYIPIFTGLVSWWRHQMETFSALLAICAGNAPVPGEFPTQRPVTRSLMLSLICVWINSWVSNREAGDFRRYRAHYDVTLT